MTSTNYDLNAVHGLNKYLWNKLTTTGVMNTARYTNGLTPIIPTQQVPTFNNMIDQLGGTKGVPFIVYHWTAPAVNVNDYTQLNHILYMIYSAEEEEHRQIGNLISEEFHRWDYAAADVNTFIQAAYGPTGVTPDHRYANFDYKALSVVNYNAGLPAATEDGRSESSVSVRVSFGYDSQEYGRRT